MKNTLRAPLAALALTGALVAPVVLSTAAYAATPTATSASSPAPVAVPTSFTTLTMTTDGDDRVKNADGTQYKTTFSCSLPKDWKLTDADSAWSIFATNPEQSAWINCRGQAMTMPTYDGLVKWKTSKATSNGWVVTAQESTGDVRVVRFEHPTEHRTLVEVFKYDGHAVLESSAQYPTNSAAAWKDFPLAHHIAFEKGATKPDTSTPSKPSASASAKPSQTTSAKPTATSSSTASKPSTPTKRGVPAKTGADESSPAPLDALGLGLRSLGAALTIAYFN